jgi:long-chain fatty acid transport protein
MKNMNTVKRSLPPAQPAAFARGPALVALVLILSPLCVCGEGFRNPPAGTFNLGRAGGRIAQIDDASAIQQNPANLLDVKQTQAEFTPSIVYIHVDYTSPSGVSAETENPWKLLPNFFASTPVMDDRVVVGFGLTTPYGLANEWEQTGAFADPLSLKYQAPYFTELMTINANPTVAVRLLDNLTLGAGLDVTWSQLTFKQLYPWLAFPGSTGTEPDGKIKAEGDGFGFGGNMGLTWQIAEKHRLAVTYRSPIQVNYEGTFQINNVTPTATFVGVTPESKFETEIKFPTIVALGYGIQVTDNVRLELDGEWLQFSNFKSLDLNVGNNALLFPSTSIAQNWKNTYTVGIGGDWRFSPDWVVRFGYQHYETPVPDSTLSTTIPDANQNVFTVGLGYQHGHHAFEGGYGFDIYADRTITDNVNPAFNGTYGITVHLFSLSYRYSF